MSELTLIAAIGQSGQLGLKGDMPWGRGFPEDLKHFRRVTTGGVVVVGYRTLPTVAALSQTRARTVLLDDTDRPPAFRLEILRMQHPDRPIFIAGGAKTYRRWLPLITAFDVTRVPYEGPADVYAEFLLPHVTRELAP